MSETVVGFGIEETYAQLKAQLSQNQCKIIAEDTPNVVSAVQGSLWGISAKTAQKKITYKLNQDAKGTHIRSHTILTSGYVRLTVAGCVFSVGLMSILIWIALDLQAYALVSVQGFWGWLVEINGYVDPNEAALLIRFMWILTALLAGMLITEGIVVANVRVKIGVFAEQLLQASFLDKR